MRGIVYKRESAYIGRDASPFMLIVKICLGALGVRDDGVRFSIVFHAAKALQ